MISAQTVTRNIDLLVDLLLVRRLQPFTSMPARDWSDGPKYSFGIRHCPYPARRRRLRSNCAQLLSHLCEKGFHLAVQDLKADRQSVVNSGSARYPISSRLDAIDLAEMAAALVDL
jgi:hypothetical protein